MRVFKNRWFQKWATREGLSDRALTTAVEEIENGLIDVCLGGQVVKKRVASPGRGKRGGFRTLVVYQRGNKAFFVYGFSKNERANISARQLKALKLLATHLLAYTNLSLIKAINADELIEVKENDK